MIPSKRIVALLIFTSSGVAMLRAAGAGAVSSSSGSDPVLAAGGPIAWAGLAALAALIGSLVGLQANRRLRSALERSRREQADAVQRLRESEARFKTLFEGAVEGVYESTPEEGFCAVNPALARIFGCTSIGEFMGWAQPDISRLYVEADRRQAFLSALEESDTLSGFESEVWCIDRSTKWISENVWVIRNASGGIQRLHGFISDVTARKRAEADLRAGEERYRVLFEHSPVAIMELDFREAARWLQDLKGLGVSDFESYANAQPAEFELTTRKVKMVALNNEAVALFGAQSKLEMAADPEHLAAAAMTEVRRKILSALWQGRTELHGEWMLLGLDQRERHVHFRWSVPAHGGKPDLAWTQLVAVDVSAIKRIQGALAAERERLIVTLRAMAEAVITTDTEGVIQFINQAAERLTGWTEGAAVGRPAWEVCSLRHQRTEAAVAMPVVEALSEGHVVEIPAHTALVHRRGVVCAVEGRCAPINDPDGRPAGAVMVLRDISQRTRLEAELQRASKLESVGVLAGGIAHDFNNLLTVIMGNLTLAMLDRQVVSLAGKWLRDAERGAMRARDLTAQLLTFAKGGEPVREAVRLPEVVREAAQFALHGSSVRCEVNEDSQLWPADIDQGQIGQVVQNLVLNAIQAMPDGGVIRISMQNDKLEADPVRRVAPGSYLRLTVADSGTGIAPENVGRIFDPYFTTKKAGNGLGLATVYSIVKKHDGYVEVESELGRGTTFKIWLPAASGLHPAGNDASDEPQKTSGRVLFMDDEETICEMMRVVLERLGYDVTIVRDGAKVLTEYVAAQQTGKPYDVVMMDLTVPGGMGGRETMQELLKLDPAVRGIVSSGYSSDPVMADFKEFGFRGRVAKPYRVQDLSKALRLVMEERVGSQP